MPYKHLEIEQKWQKVWEDRKTFEAEFPSSKPKFYALDMFPYPSGSGLHVGHLASYLPTDIVARYKRAKGFNVLHPMGYDSFGLPAEQYAIETGVHPEVTTQKAIKTFRRQLESFGFSFDWSKSLATTDPSFLKWTQFIFTELFNKGLAFQKEVPVNWCPALKTVLANEEVVNGKSERGGHPVERMPMNQWMLKITDYAEKLLQGLETVDWPSRTKEGQKNWIGKSVGANVSFKIKGTDKDLKVFTTRPDTLFGATFMVLAPEHPLAPEISTTENLEKIQDYIKTTASKSEVDRQSSKEKTGVFTGAHALHPLTGKEIPIWIADYVLYDYGTGAIMAVPAHDERDYAFAEAFGLEITRVLDGGDLPFVGEGKLVNSDFLNGLSKKDAIKKAISVLEEKGTGTKETLYKLRDWLFSRQRFWGEPIPIVHNNDGTSRALSLEELPLTLPVLENYEPSDSGDAPLAKNKDWMTVKGGGTRESHTMPGSAGSSWYFLRYPDTENENEICSKEKQDYWLPVDLYVGGPEHTVGHLLYSRFWTKFLKDQNLISIDEPFSKLAHQGMILGPDGEKMSKSRGNVINPDDVKEEFGTDAVRIYISFMGPFERDKPWNTKGIEGSRRFLERVWRLCVDEDGQSILTDEALSEDLTKTVHKTIKKVTGDIESMSFNTAVSAMMILVNELYKEKCHSKSACFKLLKMLSPFAPHTTQELWALTTGKESLLCEEAWPVYEEELCVEDSVEMAVQINGKVRGKIQISLEASEEEALKLAKAVENIQTHLEGKKIIKVIYKACKILNLIAK
jgi:leucyl-tRNA synthetase